MLHESSKLPGARQELSLFLWQELPAFSISQSYIGSSLKTWVKKEITSEDYTSYSNHPLEKEIKTVPPCTARVTSVFNLSALSLAASVKVSLRLYFLQSAISLQLSRGGAPRHLFQQYLSLGVFCTVYFWGRISV